MNRKGFSSIVLVAFIIMLGVAVAYFWLIKKQTPSNNNGVIESNTTSALQQSSSSAIIPPSQTKQISWSNLIPDIRAALGSTFLGSPIEESRPLSVYKEADITGDGVTEALVNLGTGGAYTDYLTLMRIENGKPTTTQFKQQDGKVSPLIFLDGTSVRYGESTIMIPDKNAMYQGSWSIDDHGKVNSCTVVAYQWNAQTKTFDFNLILGNEIKPDFCRKETSN